MKIEIHVKPNCRKQGIEEKGERLFEVRVHAPPQDGKANAAVIELLAEHFGVPKSSIVILRGLTSKKKLVEIAD